MIGNQITYNIICRKQKPLTIQGITSRRTYFDTLLNKLEPFLDTPEPITIDIHEHVHFLRQQLQNPPTRHVHVKLHGYARLFSK